MRVSNILSLIGNTPLVEITKFDTGLCRLFVKMERQNPGGSIKDRIALSMISAAEKSGALKPGGTMIEATAGNTGIGLSLIGALKGYNVILVVPDKMSREKTAHCEGLGAKIIWTRSDVSKGHPEYYSDMAARIAHETGAYHVNQFNNPANPETHVKTTGPEIWAQMNGDVDAVVCGVGSGGTMAGLGKYFAHVSPKTEMILADPVGSALAGFVNNGTAGPQGAYKVEGIGQDYVPENLDIKTIKKAYAITDDESFSMARELLAREGIFVGPSSGTLLAAALKYCREQKTPKRVVSFVCDGGEKYSGKLFETANNPRSHG
jgi:cystathionine beta-synthase